MRLLKYRTASQKIVRFYKKKKREMESSLIYSFAHSSMKQQEEDRI